jgi:hypothetical protein
MPASGYDPEYSPEQSSKKAASGEERLQVIKLDPTTAADMLEAPPHTGQYHQVHDRDRQKEKHGDAAANDSAERLECGEPALQRSGGCGDTDRCNNDNSRMTEREKEPDGDRSFPFLHKLAYDIVDRRDVIGVDGMAQAECVGQERGRKQRRAIRQLYECPCPGERVRQDEHRADGDGLVPVLAWLVVEQLQKGHALRALPEGELLPTSMARVLAILSAGAAMQPGGGSALSSWIVHRD